MDKLILDYKNALSKKDCKHFNKGKGKCPFGNRCFYRHALADGRLLDVGPPPQPSRRRQRRAAANRRQRHNSGDLDSVVDLHMVEHMILQEISEYFEFRWGWMADMMSDLSDDDDDDEDDDDDDDDFFDLIDLQMF